MEETKEQSRSTHDGGVEDKDDEAKGKGHQVTAHLPHLIYLLIKNQFQQKKKKIQTFSIENVSCVSL